jgi:hypothetical protein
LLFNGILYGTLFKKTHICFIFVSGFLDYNAFHNIEVTSLILKTKMAIFIAKKRTQSYKVSELNRRYLNER